MESGVYSVWLGDAANLTAQARSMWAFGALIKRAPWAVPNDRTTRQSKRVGVVDAHPRSTCGMADAMKGMEAVCRAHDRTNVARRFAMRVSGDRAESSIRRDEGGLQTGQPATLRDRAAGKHGI